MVIHDSKIIGTGYKTAHITTLGLLFTIVGPLEHSVVRTTDLWTNINLRSGVA